MTLPQFKSEIGFRLGLLERAMAENGRRISELERTLAVTGAGSDRTFLPEHREIIIDADAVSPFASGFYSRQIDNSGRSYRWAGRGDFFELRFALDRTVAWIFKMEIHGNSQVSLDQIRAFVDYVEIPLDFEPSDPTVRGTVPIRAFSTLAVMTFYLPHTFIPCKVDPSSTDQRTLSVVFYNIHLVPAASAASDQQGATK